MSAEVGAESSAVAANVAAAVDPNVGVAPKSHPAAPEATLSDANLDGKLGDEESAQIRRFTAAARPQQPPMSREEMEEKISEEAFKATMQMCDIAKYRSVFDEALSRYEITRQFMLMRDGKGPRAGADVTTKAWLLVESARFIHQLVQYYTKSEKSRTPIEKLRSASYKDCMDGSPFIGMIISQGDIDEKAIPHMQEAAMDLEACASSLFDALSTGGFSVDSNPKRILFILEKMTDRIFIVRSALARPAFNNWISSSEVVRLMNEVFASKVAFLRSYFTVRDPTTKAV